MPDYHGTPGADNLDQATLGLADGTAIFGDGGNDTIAVDYGLAIGGAGNDVLIGRSLYSTAAYFNSTTGVTVNLATGTASDGLGGTDTLSGFLNVQGSSWDDTLIGSAANETFVGGGGNNTIDGGAGYDIAAYYFQPSTKATVTYNAATDTLTVVKNFSNGDHGTDTLTGIEEVRFSGAGSDEVSYLPDSLSGHFRQQLVAVALNLGNYPLFVQNISSGDFNGDGNTDILLVEQYGLGTALEPSVILTGDGKGNFINSTSSVFADGSFMNKIAGGRTYVADFNKDGVSDIFQLNYGVDDLTMQSDKNAVALSNAATHKLVNTSAALTSTAAQNHAGVVGDFTGDGFADVVIATLDKGLRYLTNDGQGGFAETTAKLPLAVLSVGYGSFLSAGAADVNGDGAVDLLLGGGDIAASVPSSVLLNPGNGDFSGVTPIALPKSGVPGETVLDTKSIDLNGDGLADLVRSITSGGSTGASGFYTTPYIQFLVNEGGGQFRDVTGSMLPQSKQPASDGVANWYIQLTAVDFNRDGFTDILGWNSSGSSISPIHSQVFLNNGNGTFSADQKFLGMPTAIDANSDGMIDLATVTRYGGALTVNLNAMTNQHIYKAEFGETLLTGSDGDDVMSDRGGHTSFFGGGGKDTITGGSGNNTLTGGAGDDALNGGSGVDTAVFAGNRGAYTVTSNGSSFTIGGTDGVDTLTAVEYARFDDQTIRLVPGNGATIDFSAAPATYMAPIRDFDGNNLTGQGTQRIDPGTGALVGGGAWDGVSGWSLAGIADVSGGGLQSHILFNNQVGRWAEVTSQTDGKVYFSNHGWSGDTRIVGIYIDPLVQSGAVVAGSDTDSQRRFQNDLFIGNLKSVLSAADYDKDGGQEVYFSLTDGTAYLHTYMHADGNIRYANYQSKQQVQDYLAANSYGGSTTWLAAAPPEKLAATWSDDAPPMAAAEPLGFRDLIAPDNGILAAAGV